MIEQPSIEENEGHGGFGSLGVSLGLLVVAWSAGIASFPIHDNSFFTHLATGRLILDEASVPDSDPYTFTAAGVDWTVQSWLASVAYAGAERLGGVVGLRALVLIVFLVAGALLWRLSRPTTSIVVRLLVVAGALLVVTTAWSERPYMMGFIGLAVVWLALEGALRPLWLVPLLWVWANAHGSFPLATVLVLTVLVGEALDRRRLWRGDDDFAGVEGDDAGLSTELAVLRSVLVGTLLAAIGPLGIDVLLFPVKSVTRSDLLTEIVEWQSPEFQSVADRVFLVLVLLTFAGLVRVGRWRLAIPTLVFAAAAVVAQRNVVMAVAVLVPVLAACAPSVGTLTGRTKPALGTAFSVVSGLVAVLVGMVALTSPLGTLEPYPARPLAWLGPLEGVGNVATQDFTGNLLEVLDGPRNQVFIDDRADMFPHEIFADATTLRRAEPAWRDVLDRHDIDIVVWKRSEALASVLAADRAWRMAFVDTTWAVSCRRAADACARVTD